MDEEEARARLRLIQIQKDRNNIAQEEPSLLKQAMSGTANRIRSAASGAVPFYDEMTSAARATIDPSTYGEDRDWGERYDLAAEQERGGVAQYRQDNPLESMALETTTGFFSPINKLGPAQATATGLTNAVKGLSKNVARNATEAAIFGAGENNQDRTQGAIDAAQTAATFTGLLDAGGRTVGGALDAVKLKNPVSRNPETGKFDPTHMSNPKSVRGWVQRNVLGRLPGGNENLVAQQLPQLQEAGEAVSDAQRVGAREAADTNTRFREEDWADIDTAKAERANIGRQQRYNERQGVVEPDLQPVPERMNAKAPDVTLDNPVIVQRRASNAVAGIPESKVDEVFKDVDMSDPEAMDEAVGRWWNDSGFQDVKDETFSLPKTVQTQLEGIAADPTTRLEFGEVLRPVAVKRNIAAGGDGVIDPDEGVDLFIERMLDGKISGEELMALRNNFAIASNQGSGIPAGKKRAIANTFDTVIRDGLEESGGQKAVDFFDEQINKYTTNLTNRKAVESAYKTGGRYNLDQYEDAGKAFDTRLPSETRQRRPQGREVRSSKRQLEQAVAQQEQAATDAASQANAGRDATIAANNAANASARQATTASNELAGDIAGEQRSILDSTVNEKKRVLTLAREQADLANKATSEARLTPLQEDLKAKRGYAVGGHGSPHTAVMVAPQGLPGGAGSKIGLVSRAGDILTGEGMQQFIAGQGKRTRQLADAIRSGRSEYVTRALSREAARLAAREEEENR